MGASIRFLPVHRSARLVLALAVVFALVASPAGAGTASAAVNCTVTVGNPFRQYDYGLNKYYVVSTARVTCDKAGYLNVWIGIYRVVCWPCSHYRLGEAYRENYPVSTLSVTRKVACRSGTNDYQARATADFTKYNPDETWGGFDISDKVSIWCP